MTEFYSLSFKKNIMNSRKLLNEELWNFLKELIWFHWVINTKWNQRLWWKDKISWFIFFENLFKFLKTHLLYKNRLSWGYTSTTCKTVIESYSSFCLLLTRLYYFGLDTVLRRRYVVINLCQFYNSSKHVDYIE